MRKNLSKLTSFNLGTRHKDLEKSWAGMLDSQGGESTYMEHGKGSPALLPLWFSVSLQHVSPTLGSDSRAHQALGSPGLLAVP